MKFKLFITFSKLMSFLILGVTSVYSIMNHEATVITLGTITAAGLLGFRQYTQKGKQNEKINIIH